MDNEPEVFWDGQGAADVLEQWRREVRFDDHSWGRVDLPEAGNNGPSGQWLRDNILAPLGYSRADCWITDCLDTARLNPGQQRRISQTYLPVIGGLGLLTPNMEPTPTGESSIIREARQGHLERLSQELDTARPELIITLGNAALRVLRLLVEIDSGDPGPALAETSYGAELRARLGARPVRWLPLVHPARASEYRNGARPICVGWSAPMTGFRRSDLLTIGFEGFVSFAGLDLGVVPVSGGVYVLLREGDRPPSFLASSPAGWFKGRNPSLAPAEA